jgi:peptidoglycan LD-endopeptidase CwlK
MTYSLGRASRQNLLGVHPKLVDVVERAIELTEQDFTVFEGLRTVERQREYVRKGVSKTMNSKHLKQADGYGHAVDLVPYIDGTARWEWGPIYEVAAAMCQAAKEQGTLLTWGGAWDRRINGMDCVASRMKAEVESYCARHPGPDFIDGPHYELVL